MKYEGAKNEKGEYHGSGTLIDSLGFIYQGEFINGKLNGQGTLTFDRNYPYFEKIYFNQLFGSFLPDSTSCIKCSNHGNKYVGEFKDGLMHGEGTSTSFDGKKYVGEFKDGLFHGKGIFSSNSGKFIGEFKNGEPYNGKGTYYYSSFECKSSWDDCYEETIFTVDNILSYNNLVFFDQ